MQRAFYIDGKDLNDPFTYQEIARAQGIDAQLVAARLAEPAATAAARADFARAQRLGAGSFPTLFLLVGERAELLSRGLVPLQTLEANLAGITGMARPL